MPYHILRRDHNYFVINDLSGRTMGKFGSEKGAKKQLAALYANEKDMKDHIKMRG